MCSLKVKPCDSAKADRNPRSKLQGVESKRRLAGEKGLAEKQGKTVEEGDRTGAVMKK